MSKHTRMSGGIGLAAFVAVALALTGCEEFEEPRTGAPHVIGVMIGDLNINEAVPLPNPGECLPSSGEAPYPEPDPGRMPAGVCGGPISVCPVACYPPRVGPAFAPLFAGGLATSYPCLAADARCPASGTATVSAPSPEVYVLTNVLATTYTDANAFDFLFGQIRIQFNLLMDPASIEPVPFSGVAAAGILVEAGATGGPLADITGTSAVHYIPNSPSAYWGATMLVLPPADAVTGGLTPGWTYRVTGQVRGQDGAPLDIDVTVETAP